MFAQESVMDIQKEREAFEVCMAEKYKNLIDRRQCLNNGGGYMAWDMNVAWQVWQAAKAQAVPKWISVKDNLPPANILVLGMSQTRSNIFNIYNVMALDEFEEVDVTHWMPLPDAPQEPTND